MTPADLENHIVAFTNWLTLQHDCIIARAEQNSDDYGTVLEPIETSKLVQLIRQFSNERLIAIKEESNTMKVLFYLVTDGSDFAFWNYRNGCWDSKSKFEPICLQDVESAESVQRAFNTNRDLEDSEWIMHEVWLEFATKIPIAV